MIELFRDFWHMILTAIAAIVFVVRMEGKSAIHEVRIVKLEGQREADRDEFLLIMRDMNTKMDRLIERNLK